MNVLDKTAINNCTSCGACAAICVKNAINMALDNDGFYRPVIDNTICNNCGLCTTICYKFDNEVRITTGEELKQKPLFSAWALDDDVVRSTTSGGLGYLLARHYMREGYKVVGVIYNKEKVCAEHQIASTEEELSLFRGSKYIQSYTFDAFKVIMSNCHNEKYVVFGTPCQIYTLNKMAVQRKVKDNFIFVDLYCHGCPSYYIWFKFQNEVKRKIKPKKFNTVSFRSKLRGWGAFNVVFDVNGKSFTNGKFNDKFYELFFSDQLLNSACQDCKLRSSLEYTDIRLGDFWGIKFLNNCKGVSAISIVTPQGKNVFDGIKDHIFYSNCDYQDFLPWQSWGKTYYVNYELRNAVLDSLRNPQEDINDAIRVLRKKQSFANNLIRIAKCTFAIFPLRYIKRLKQIKYFLK